MPRPGRRRRTRQRLKRGFTLLEVLVVVIIIAVLTTIGVLSIGVLGGDRQRGDEIQRFEDATATAVQEAELEGRDFGLRLQKSSYEIYVYSPRRNRWEEVPDDRLYAVHKLPAGLELGLTLDGREVKLDDDPPGKTDIVDATTELNTGVDRSHAELKPQLIFFASGDVSPYHLEWRRAGGEDVWTLDQDADGKLTARSPEQIAAQQKAGNP